MTAPGIYLDHNASAPLLPGVRDAVASALDQVGNPSSVHRAGRAAKQAIEQARDAVAACVGARSQDVTFTSGGTEANALALAQAGNRPVAVTAIEHESILAAVPTAHRLPVTEHGILDLNELERWLVEADRPTYVSVMLANNETGVIQPVAEAARLAHRFGALVHCDAAQAIGRLRFAWQDMGVDFMTVSAHKMGGPKGVGALIAAGEQVRVPLLKGGGQERGIRAGTENLPGIAGFGFAAEHAWPAWRSEHIARLRDYLEEMLRACAPEVKIHGGRVARLANTSCVGLPDASSAEQVIALDLVGIAVSAGAACSSGKVTPSHVLSAMGANASEARSAIRVSLGPQTTEVEIDRFIHAWLIMRTALTGRPISSAA